MLPENQILILHCGLANQILILHCGLANQILIIDCGLANQILNRQMIEQIGFYFDS
jgi:hypothetical protein